MNGGVIHTGSEQGYLSLESKVFSHLWLPPSAIFITKEVRHRYLLSSSVIVTTAVFGLMVTSGSVVVSSTEKLSSSSRIVLLPTVIVAQSHWRPFPGLKVSWFVSNKKSPGAIENINSTIISNEKSSDATENNTKVSHKWPNNYYYYNFLTIIYC